MISYFVNKYQKYTDVPVVCFISFGKRKAKTSSMVLRIAARNFFLEEEKRVFPVPNRGSYLAVAWLNPVTDRNLSRKNIPT